MYTITIALTYYSMIGADLGIFKPLAALITLLCNDVTASIAMDCSSERDSCSHKRTNRCKRFDTARHCKTSARRGSKVKSNNNY